MKNHIVPHSFKVDKQERNKANGHKSLLLFFTGLSGSGKSTIANALEQKLHMEGIKTFVLDGDNIRNGLNKDLTFAPKDRSENIRRISEVGKLMVDAGLVTLAAFVAPYQKDREFVRETIGKDNYIEIFVNASLEVCEKRDVKGLYKKARNGEITNMTGISAPYEAPQNPDVEVTHHQTVEESVNSIYNKIIERIKP